MSVPPGVGPVGGRERAESIDGVLSRLAAIEATLPRTDGVAYFNRLYLALTDALEDGLRHISLEDASFFTRLDVVHANLYFDALAQWDARCSCPDAWRPLFSARAQARPRPVQFVLAGLIAHLHHDLPIAVVRACHERGAEPARESPQYRDFERVNGVLRSVESQIEGWFTGGFIADADRLSGDEGEALAAWSIAAAREMGWHHAETLWQLREQPGLRSAYIETLAGLSEVAARAILV